jgi:hypothetical protein
MRHERTPNVRKHPYFARLRARELAWRMRQSGRSPAFTRSRTDRSPGEFMSLKRPCIATMEAHFKQWGATLDEMKARLEAGEMEERLELHRQVDASQRQHELARRHLDELKQTGTAAWAALEAGMESAWRELELAVDKPK